MGFESSYTPEIDKTFVRANKTANLLYSGECKTFGEAAGKVVRGEGITHPPDVKRIISEISQEFHRRKQQNADWDEIVALIHEESAAEMLEQRGGDPED